MTSSVGVLRLESRISSLTKQLLGRKKKKKKKTQRSCTQSAVLGHLIRQFIQHSIDIKFQAYYER